jgi:hypothetical protein
LPHATCCFDISSTGAFVFTGAPALDDSSNFSIAFRTDMLELAVADGKVNDGTDCGVVENSRDSLMFVVSAALSIVFEDVVGESCMMTSFSARTCSAVEGCVCGSAEVLEVSNDDVGRNKVDVHAGTVYGIEEHAS